MPLHHVELLVFDDALACLPQCLNLRVVLPQFLLELLSPSGVRVGIVVRVRRPVRRVCHLERVLWLDTEQATLPVAICGGRKTLLPVPRFLKV